MATPIQTGNQLLARPAPTFADYVVVGGTWKETDPLAVTATLDGNEETHNYTGVNAGIDAECDLVVKADKAPLKKLDTLTGTREDWTGGGKIFVVVDVSTSDFGGKPVKQSVKLEQRDSLTAVLTGP